MKSPRVLTAAELRAQGGRRPDCLYIAQSFVEITLADLMKHRQETFESELMAAWSEQWGAIIARDDA